MKARLIPHRHAASCTDWILSSAELSKRNADPERHQRGFTEPIPRLEVERRDIRDPVMSQMSHKLCDMAKRGTRCDQTRCTGAIAVVQQGIVWIGSSEHALFALSVSVALMLLVFLKIWDKAIYVEGHVSWKCCNMSVGLAGSTFMWVQGQSGGLESFPRTISAWWKQLSVCPSALVKYRTRYS